MLREKIQFLLLQKCHEILNKVVSQLLSRVIHNKKSGCLTKNHHLFLPRDSLQNQDPDPDKRIGTESREKKRIRRRPFFGLDDFSKPNCGHFSSNQIFFCIWKEIWF